MQYKCLNPNCRHSWETRGEYAKVLRCPRCHTGYVLDYDTFEAAVLAEANWLESPIPPDVAAAHLATHATVIRKLFPRVPFNALQVINDEASQRIEQAKKQGGQTNERIYPPAV